MKNLKAVYALIALFLLITTAKAQDQIITTSGKTIHGHVKNVKNDEITYRKYFHKYHIDTDKVLYIVNENGVKRKINDITMANHYKNYTEIAKNNPPSFADTIRKPAYTFHPLFIERVGNNFRIDSNRIIGPGTLNGLLAQSPSPVVKLNLKAAKTMRTITAITKVSSYPSSAGGAFASYNTFKTLFDQMKEGPVTTKMYINAGLSFMATITVPITGSILKHIQNKLYDKTLISYSLGN